MSQPIIIQVKALVDEAQTKLSNMSTKVIGILAALGAAFAALTKRAIDYADEMGKAAQRTGTAVEVLSKLAYSGKLADVSLEGLSNATKKLSQAVNEANKGQEASVKLFQDLGIAIQNTDGGLKSVDQLILELSDRFKEMPDGVEKVALAVKLFGLSGQAMIPMLNQGSEALRQQAAEAEAFGQVVGPEFTANAQEFNDNLTKFGEAFKGVFLVIAEKLLPALVKFTAWGVQWIKDSKAVFAVAEAMVLVFRGLAVVFVGTAMALKTLIATTATFLGFVSEGQLVEGWRASWEQINEEFVSLVENMGLILGIYEKLEEKEPLDLGAITKYAEGMSHLEIQMEQFTTRFKDNIFELSVEWIQLGRNMADVFTRGIGRAIDATTDSIMGLIDGTTTWQQAFSQAARGIIADIIRIVLQWAVSQAIIGALGKKASAERIVQSGAEAAAAGPAALFNSISTMGIAAGIGLAALLAAMAVTGGFAEGGPVKGPGTSSSDSIMARLSNGEFVLRAAAVQQYGLDTVNSMNQGTLPMGGGSGPGGSGGVNVSPTPVNFAVINNRSELKRFLESNDGRQMIVDAVTARKMELGLES